MLGEFKCVRGTEKPRRPINPQVFKIHLNPWLLCKTIPSWQDVYDLMLGVVRLINTVAVNDYKLVL